ncbi:MAG: RNA methyltransferase [Bacteroidales bacterium]|nr:RNA methyltransferase [Bacteroidales bacterium]
MKNADSDPQKALLDHLLEFLTPNRKSLFEKVIANRTRHITVILEDIYQPHNASAVLRTCDLTGIQDVHIIENNNQYDVNPDVALGASKWLNLFKYNETEQNTLLTFEKLRKQGYRIVASTPHKNDQDLESIPLDGKMAIVFGTELNGLSDIAFENADEFLKIPMFGFTESYNISVSAALILFTLTNRLRNSSTNWSLSEDEKQEILLEWSRRSIKRSDIIENQFLKNRK